MKWVIESAPAINACGHFISSLDDQTQVDSEPAGQPEPASLNQCQLITANSPKLVLWACPADCGDWVSQ